MKEKQVSSTVIPIIEGNLGDNKCVSGGIPFTNLEPLTDGSLTPGNLDIYYGARPEQLNRQVREDLHKLIVPSTQDDLPILTNFVLAAKGPDGSLAVGTKQACYDGVLGSRGIRALQYYGQETEVFDNEANTITSIYHGGQLKMFTVHPYVRENSEKAQENCMHQLNAWSMTGSLAVFREGATAYRNGRDWAKERRDQIIMRANKRAAKVLDCSGPSIASMSSFQYSKPHEIEEQDLASSFTTETSTIGPLSQALSPDVQPDEGSETTIEEIQPKSNDSMLDSVPGNKRAHRLSRELQARCSKKRNASSGPPNGKGAQGFGG